MRIYVNSYVGVFVGLLGVNQYGLGVNQYGLGVSCLYYIQGIVIKFIIKLKFVLNLIVDINFDKYQRV